MMWGFVWIFLFFIASRDNLKNPRHFFDWQYYFKERERERDAYDGDNDDDSYNKAYDDGSEK